MEGLMLNEASGEQKDLTFRVKVSAPLMTQGNREEGYTGPGHLRVSSDGFVLEGQGFMNKNARLERTWADVRELRDEVRARGWFGAELGGLRLRFKVQEGPMEALAGLLEALPLEVRGARCPACGGSVHAGSCRACGTRPRTFQRHRAWGFLGARAGMLLLGLAATIASEALAATLGHASFLLPSGLVLGGLATLLYGLVKLVTGTGA
jgi:hypothetical protein